MLGVVFSSVGVVFSSVLQVWLAFEPDDPFGRILNLGLQMNDFLHTLDVIFAAVGRCTPPSVAKNFRNARKFGNSHSAEVLVVVVLMS